MILLFLNAIGRLIAVLPTALLQPMAALGGEAILWLLPRRRRVLLSNLHHAFPDRSPAWRKAVAREGSRRLVETAMLSLAAPFLSEGRIRSIATLGSSVESLCRDMAERPRPVVFATLHLALWETQTWLKALSPVPLPPFGIIFRPLDNPQADAFVKRTRERHGMRLLSRKEGFAEALAILRDKGAVGVLFDQNAGMQGGLSLLFGRVCSSTELPGLFAAKHGADLRTFYPRRTGFWKVTFESNPIDWDGTAAGGTLALNRWLEGALEDPELCRSWLWAHDRWRNQDVPSRRLRLEAKRNLLQGDVSARGLAALPRKTRIWIRMPNWLGDVVMALGLLRTLRESRPDAEVTLLSKGAFVPFLKATGLAEHVRALPDRGIGYFPSFWRLRGEYPDCWILFTQSVRGDLEAYLCGCRQRFGIVRRGKRRPLLSHAYRPPENFDEREHHQIELWTAFLHAFGMQGEADTSPLPEGGPLGSRAGSAGGPIGLIVGSENTPAKRWPVEHWRALVRRMPQERFELFGTPADRALTSQVALEDPSRVVDRAGTTSLLEFAVALRRCRLLVTNDTGGMHLANALGVPLVGLFGPTNPVRTAPVFQATHRILQPPGCPPNGGGDLALLTPESVAEAVRDLPTGA